MQLKNQAIKLLTNKYFLYAMVFLSATNMIGYLAMNRLNAVIFFALVSLITYHFNKNMAIVLLIALVATNLLMANKRIREGLDNGPTKDASGNLVDSSGNVLTKPDNTVDASGNIVDASGNIVDASGNIVNVKDKIKAQNEKISQLSQVDAELKTAINDIKENADVKNRIAEKKSTTDEGFEPEGAGANTKSKTSSRIDYAATLEGAYDNLDKILGSDGINKLTSDTQRLMSQQQKLFDTMQNMVPMIKDAKSMLAGFDLKNLGGDITKLASTFK